MEYKISYSNLQLKTEIWKKDKSDLFDAFATLLVILVLLLIARVAYIGWSEWLKEMGYEKIESNNY